MTFYMPAKVFEQEDCVHAHGKDMAALGKRALIVTGRSSAKKNGSFDDVRKALEENGVAWELFNGVEENPSIETVMAGTDKALSFRADFIVGIGGGSPLDAAKAIALMAFHKNKGAEYLYAKGGNSSALPLVAVPTTCGTGSEVTGVSVLTIHAKQTKGSISHKIFPTLALIDGKYLSTAPLSVIANTAMDALAHLFESYVNSASSDYSRMCATSGMAVWKKIKNFLSEKRSPGKEESFLLMRSSTLAGMAIAQNGTSLPHALSYPLTYHLGMPHGKAVSYFLAGYLAQADSEDRDFVLRAAGFKDLDQLQAFYQEICGKEKIRPDILEKAISSVAQNKAKLASAPFFADDKVLRKIAFFG